MTTRPNVALEALPGAKSPKWGPAGKLLFSNWLSPLLRNRIQHVPRTSHTNSLGWLEEMLRRQLESLAGPRSITFDPGTEYALSAVAARHWLELALAVFVATRKDFVPWLTSFGVAAAGVPLLDALLDEPDDHPLLEVVVDRKAYLAGVVRGDAESFLFDVDVGPQSRAELPATEIAKLRDASKSGVCACFFCAGLRAKRSKMAAVKKKEPLVKEPDAARQGLAKKSASGRAKQSAAKKPASKSKPKAR